MGGSNRGAMFKEGIVHGGKCPGGGKCRGEMPGGEVSGHPFMYIWSFLREGGGLQSVTNWDKAQLKKLPKSAILNLMFSRQNSFSQVQKSVFQSD